MGPLCPVSPCLSPGLPEDTYLCLSQGLSLAPQVASTTASPVWKREKIPHKNTRTPAVLDNQRPRGWVLFIWSLKEDKQSPICARQSEISLSPPYPKQLRQEASPRRLLALFLNSCQPLPATRYFWNLWTPILGKLPCPSLRGLAGNVGQSRAREGFQNQLSKLKYQAK